MALVVGTNSWATVAEANTYFTTSYGRSDWAGFTDTVKETLLITAFNWINQQSQFSIAASNTTDIVKQAQYEAAWYWYKYHANTEDRRALFYQGVREFEISKFREELEAPMFPDFIGEILEDYLSNVGGQIVTVTRELST